MISLTSPIKTRAHTWPAWAKIAGLCVASVALYHVHGPVLHGLVACVVLALYALPGKIFFWTGLSHLKLLVPFVVIVIAYHVWARSLLTGAEVVFRMIAAVGLANLVTMTTKLADLIAVLKWLTAPLRFIGLNPHALSLSIALVIRFTPVLLDKLSGLLEAWRARSRTRPSWRIILPFIVAALDDADDVAEALKARGGVSK